jgi:nicotinamide mononucleotide (NMN) deamidase PncC
MNIPMQVVSFLSSRGLKLGTAESCTAGKIASYIASVPGSEPWRFSGERNDVRSAAALYALARVEHYFNQLQFASRE